MSSKLDSLFTHIEVLRSREPLERNTEPICTMTDGPKPMQKEKQLGAPTSNNSSTYVSLLEEASINKYGAPPLYVETSLNMLHTCECTLGSWKGSAESSSKKTSKQLAAKKVLLAIVESHRHMDFRWILSADENEAVKYILDLMPNLVEENGGKESANVTNSSNVENWKGNCVTLCQKNKCNQPQYQISDEGPPNNKTFYCTAILERHSTSSSEITELVAKATGNTKKKAENSAAKELYDKLVLIFPPAEPKIAETLTMVQPTNEKNASVQSQAGEWNVTSSVSDQSAADCVPSQDEASQIGAPSTEEQFVDIKNFLKDVVAEGDETKDYENAEALFKKLLASKHPAVVKVFDSSELCFTVAPPTGLGVFHVYLEITNCVNNTTKNTFAGEGATEEIARDHACWQAMQFLYVFGGFRDGHE